MPRSNSYDAPITELTKEDFFAGMALVGMISRFDKTPKTEFEAPPTFTAQMAVEAYKIAKLMIDVSANPSNRMATRHD